MRALRKYQADGIERFLQTPKPHRFFFAWEMGAGKSYAALLAMKLAKALPLLIVCPAIVRRNWHREGMEVFPLNYLGIIEYGRKRTKLRRHQEAERTLAFEQQVQIVSYELLDQVNVSGWGGIIIDEIHHLRNTRSKSSKLVHRLMEVNPKVSALGLSGTMIPKDAQSLWNPVDTLIPDYLGERTKANGIAWVFLHRYCIKETSPYGISFRGLRPEREDDLRKKLSKICSRVVQEDFANYIPPLHVKPLYPNDDRLNLRALATQWLESVRNIQHVGIYTHLRKTAKVLHAAFIQNRTDKKTLDRNCICITGEDDTQSRDRKLKEAAESTSSLIVATTHALNQGISLSFQKAALIVEWTTSPEQVLQFIGRFARQDSTNLKPTYLNFIIGPDDVSRSKTLFERIHAINRVLKAGRAEKLAGSLFEAHEIAPKDFESAMAALVAKHAEKEAMWGNSDDEEESQEIG